MISDAIWGLISLGDSLSTPRNRPDEVFTPYAGIFQAAQKRLAENKHKSHKPTKYNYLLRGIITCAHDGMTLIGSTSGGKKNKSQYYKCKRNSPGYYDNRCRSGCLRADVAERIVWDYLCEMMQDEDYLFSQVALKREEAKEAQKVLVASIAALDTQDERDHQKLDRLLDLYSDGGITKEVFLKKKRKVETDIKDRDFERADLQARLSAAGILSEDEETELRTYRAHIANGIDNSDFATKRRLLEVLMVKVVWDSKKDELMVSGIFAPHSKILSTGTTTREARTTPVTVS